MKKFLLLNLILLSGILFTACGNKTEENSQGNIEKNSVNIKQENNVQQPDIKEILKNIVKNQESCDDNSEMFVNIVLLWNSINDKWNTEYYLVADWQWFYIDERWDLNNSCGFGNIPTTIELSQNENWYNLIRYEIAKDWNEYDSSTKEMFSDEAYKIRKDGKYKFINDKSLLEMAEEYFGVTIIPETENNFECKFCDRLWYYEPLENEDWKNNELTFNYVSEDNWNDTIYFGSDWTFKAEWSWDAGEWTRTFGQDENTVIVLNNNLDHVYDRYIITSQTENSLSTILEIIQRR